MTPAGNREDSRAGKGALQREPRLGRIPPRADLARAAGNLSTPCIPDSNGLFLGAVTEAWIEITRADGARQRHVLKPGLTVVGGRRCDVELPGAEADQLHFWDQPPKVVFVGTGAPPLVHGRASEETPLRQGDVVEWRGARIELGGLAQPRTEAISVAPGLPPPVVAAPAPAVETAPSVEGVLTRRVKAGLLVELGLAEASSARRWQDAVKRNEFDPDACSRDVLAGSAVSSTDPRLLERSSRLLRDLVMAPVQPGVRAAPKKKTSSPPRSGLAAAIGQVVMFSSCCVIVFVALFFVRWRWDWSVDDFLDRLGGLLTRS